MVETQNDTSYSTPDPSLLETLIQVSFDGQALTGVILHRNWGQKHDSA